MRGLMQDRPLLISSLLNFAENSHGDSEVVTRTVEGEIHRYTYSAAATRVRRLANALKSLGVMSSDRVATLAWNTYRHFELYYAVSGMGAVLHTINPRLFEEQIIYIVNHAEDKVLFVDVTFVSLLEKIVSRLPEVTAFVIMTDRSRMPETSLEPALCFEDILLGASSVFDWPTMDESTACSLCYTSGTTGNPKGVVFSHRSTVLHAFGAALPDSLSMSASTVALPVVPMFHANTWGLAYAAPMTGAKLVLPGPNLDGESIYDLVDAEQVTLLAGVPTVWLMLLNYLSENNRSLDSVKSIVIGGSAAPRSMIESFARKHDVQVLHAWGMTEMSPLGTVNRLLPKHSDLSAEEKLDLQAKQGRNIYAVEMMIKDDDGNKMPHDGRSFGHLMVRGPWIASSYYKGEGGEILDENGWFDTGDVATLDPDGFMQITDRSKDVIKSGGEWISSIELENIAVGHSEVIEACVIGVKHPKWDE